MSTVASPEAPVAETAAVVVPVVHSLAWSDELALNNAEMDHTHVEFVELLATCREALDGPEPALLAHFQALVAHTEEHFGQEDRWMAATQFGPAHCHAFQHQAVLGVMRECAKRAAEPHESDGSIDYEPLRVAVSELAVWFPQHAQTMDAGLAYHLATVGFDPATGTMRHPPVADEATAGGSCGTEGGGCA